MAAAASMPAEPAPSVAAASAACGCCRHAVGAGAALERAIPGLSTLSSGFGCSVAESRLCRLHDQLVGPADHCQQFAAAV
jgi:hypothetical protein